MTSLLSSDFFSLPSRKTGRFTPQLSRNQKRIKSSHSEISIEKDVDIELNSNGQEFEIRKEIEITKEAHTFINPIENIPRNNGNEIEFNNEIHNLDQNSRKRKRDDTISPQKKQNVVSNEEEIDEYSNKQYEYISQDNDDYSISPLHLNSQNNNSPKIGEELLNIRNQSRISSSIQSNNRIQSKTPMDRSITEQSNWRNVNINGYESPIERNDYYSNHEYDRQVYNISTPLSYYQQEENHLDYYNESSSILHEEQDLFITTEIDEEKDCQSQIENSLNEVMRSLHFSIPLDVPYYFIISNLVLSVHLTSSLDLQRLYTRLKNAELKSEDLLQFQCTTDSGRVICTIRRSGKLGLTGSKNIKEALRIVRFIARLSEMYLAVKHPSKQVSIRYCRICNIVVTTDLKKSIHLDKLFSLVQKDVQQKQKETNQIKIGQRDDFTKLFLIEDVSYEPEVFSALKVTFSGKVVLQIFANGRMHGMGGTKIQEFYDYLEYLLPSLKMSMEEGQCKENAIQIL